MNASRTARIHLLPAKEAPIVVIIRRKPSKVFHVMRWNTETDVIEHGSWFRGRLYPLRSDVSPDGEWMVYLALGAGGNSWNGVCKLPWLKTACEAENNGTWNGGGYWADGKTLLTNGWGRARLVERLPFQLSPFSTSYGEDEGVLYPRMGRDGWRRLEPCEEDTAPAWECRPTAKHPGLRCVYRGSLRDRGRTFAFSVRNYPNLLGPAVDWAAWDFLGQLVVARSGGVEKYRLSDVSQGKPCFERSFEDLAPPGEPETSRRAGWPVFESPLLGRVAGAFSRRRKAIRNHGRLFRCERELDEQNGRPCERFDLEIHLWDVGPTRIRLSIWEDGDLWLAIHQPGKRGWRFQMQLQGNAGSMSHEEMVSRFEETISRAYGEGKAESTEAEITQLWEKAALRPKDSSPS